MPDPKITRLLETGLRHFALGELQLAVGAWRGVLELDPNNERALGYLRLLQAEAPPVPLPGPTPPAPAGADPLSLFDGDDAIIGEEESLEPLDWAPEPLPAQPAAADSWFEPDLPDAPAERFGVELELDLAQTGPLRDPAGTDAPQAAPRVPPAAELLLGTWAETIPASPEDEIELLDVEELAPWEPPSRGSDALGLLDDAFPPPPVAVPPVLPQAPARRSDREADTLMEGARELFALGDFSGSLGLVQKALAIDPGHPEALDYLERNQDTLVQMYESKLGSLDSRPRVVLRPDEIVWLNLDHRAGFVLAQIDGTVSIDDLYAVCGLSRLDTAKILAELVEQGVMTT